jgi:replicative DNA helicase
VSTPPHDLDAERALLGAALLSPDAAAVLDRVPGDAFYKPAHGHIADAIRVAYREGQVDHVTVAALLKQYTSSTPSAARRSSSSSPAVRRPWGALPAGPTS